MGFLQEIGYGLILLLSLEGEKRSSNERKSMLETTIFAENALGDFFKHQRDFCRKVGYGLTSCSHKTESRNPGKPSHCGVYSSAWSLSFSSENLFSLSNESKSMLATTIFAENALGDFLKQQRDFCRKIGYGLNLWLCLLYTSPSPRDRG